VARTTPDPLDMDRPSYRRDLQVQVDVELLEEIDRRRGGVARMRYLEHVLEAAMRRENPHIADGWTPEGAADGRYARLAARARAVRG